VTEAEWLACADPLAMLLFLGGSGKASERKLRLFACACCRRVSHFLKDERSREAVEVGERYADGLVRADVLDEARENSCDASGAAHRAAAAAGWSADVWVANAAAIAAYGVCGHWQNWISNARLVETPIWAARANAGPEVEHVESDAARPEGIEKEQETQCQLLRDLFGPLPFRCVSLNPTWHKPQVVALATSAYDNRDLPGGTLDPARLAVLADALEEASCADAELLGHLRGPGPHVRGCWAVDLVLGKG
jgi:hypothetical protein